MLVLVLFKTFHQLQEVVFTADCTHVLRREVAVHTGTVPVALVRLAVVVDIHTVFFS